MPFLRAVSSSPHGDAAVELRSSKTLIGAGASTCDVILPDASGVLEVHALLSLSPSKSSGSLVPFSTAADGACFLNGRPVPQDGARVVHGDRVAFGTPETNAFVFELTGRASSSRSSNTRNSTQRSSTRAFRRALDALRGDREAAQHDQIARSLSAASSLPSTSQMKHGEDAGASKEQQFGRLLVDASSDSVLSDYVEKKLHQRQRRPSTKSLALSSEGDADLLRAGRSMIEPPPSLLSSLSESIASTAASPFKDSILERSAKLQTDNSLSESTAFGSTAERNYAEMEKLRLSQRMRQVNRVLNGHLAFGESYMADEDTRRSGNAGRDDDDVVLGNSRSQASRRSRIERDPSIETAKMKGASQDEEEEDEDEDDELPVMVEKPSVSSPARRSAAASDQVDGLEDLKASLVLDHLVGSSYGPMTEGGNTAVPRLSGEEDGNEGEESLTDSLPGFSEPIRGSPVSPPSPQTRPVRASRVSVDSDTRVTNTRSVNIMEPPAAVSRPKTALHQKLIDQAIRQRRLETLAQTFVRWQRGLRVQAQRRLWKAQQLRRLSSRLAVIRRDRAFAAWRWLADIQSQVVSCRLDAFQSRSAARSVHTAWAAWTRFALSASRSKLVLRGVLRGIVIRLAQHRVRAAFRRWHECSLRQGSAAREQLVHSQFATEKEARLHHTAAWYRSHIVRERLRRVLLLWHREARQGSVIERRQEHAARQHFDRINRKRLHRVLVEWRRVASKQLRRCCVVQRLLVHQAGQRLARALTMWRLATTRDREEERVATELKRAEVDSQRALEQANARHKSALTDLDAVASDRLRDLESELELKDAAMKTVEMQLEQLHDLERQVRDKDAMLESMEVQLQQYRRHKAQTAAEWTHDLEGFFERAITKCDAQIASASEELEQLLGLSDRSPDVTRFRASQFLVASMIGQKASNTNARARLQEELVASLSSKLDAGHETTFNADFDDRQLPKSAAFLRDLHQQRVTRLHQLHQSVAKLAAAATGTRDSQLVDPVRARHSRFLADAMAQREAQHVVEMTRLLLRARLAHPPPAAKY